MQSSATTLFTERLRLRPIVPDDFGKFAELMASARSAGMGGPFDIRQAWGSFCHVTALWSLFGHGGLCIELRATGESVGIVEINAGPLFPERELGWQLYQQHEGNGYATEAARALRDWAFRELRLDTLVSYIVPNNLRSIAVAQRLNGVLDTSALKQDPEDLVYRYSSARSD